MVSRQEVFLALMALKEDRPGMCGSCGGPGLDTWQTLGCFLLVLDPNLQLAGPTPRAPLVQGRVFASALTDPR